MVHATSCTRSRAKVVIVENDEIAGKRMDSRYVESAIKAATKAGASQVRACMADGRWLRGTSLRTFFGRGYEWMCHCLDLRQEGWHVEGMWLRGRRL